MPPRARVWGCRGSAAGLSCLVLVPTHTQVKHVSFAQTLVSGSTHAPLYDRSPHKPEAHKCSICHHKFAAGARLLSLESRRTRARSDCPATCIALRASCARPRLSVAALPRVPLRLRHVCPSASARCQAYTALRASCTVRTARASTSASSACARPGHSQGPVTHQSYRCCNACRFEPHGAQPQPAANRLRGVTDCAGAPWHARDSQNK